MYHLDNVSVDRHECAVGISNLLSRNISCPRNRGISRLRKSFGIQSLASVFGVQSFDYVAATIALLFAGGLL